MSTMQKKTKCPGYKGTNEPAAMNNLLTIDPRDLDHLLVTEPDKILGAIMRLNQAARYRNSLNAIELMQRLIEYRRSLSRNNKKS